MFQSFDISSDPSAGPLRVALLREWLVANGLEGFLVPRADAHQGEYVPTCAERLKWLTGFSGSAGVALVLVHSAHLFVDGRYTLQAREETETATFTIESLVDEPPRKWIARNTGRGTRIGFDPWLHTIAEVRELREAAEKTGAELVALAENPIDRLWEDQPAPPLEPVTIHPGRLSGEAAEDKLTRLAAAVGEGGADCTVLTDPSSLAWAFNIRGHDVPHTPLALGFCLLSTKGGHVLFMDEAKLPPPTRAHLESLADILPPSALETTLAARAEAGETVGLDSHLAAERLRLIVEENGGKVAALADPARLPRATKNAAELDGARAAHRRDGAAVVRFLAWLDAQPPGSLDEIAAVRKLEESRRVTGEAMQMPLRDLSFDTISGSGPNGAVIHYRVNTRTNRTLGDGELYLVDSGAQYEDGTTDITRTVAIGRPSEEMRERWTLVLKGMIGVSLLRFPAGTRGMDIDAVARLALWKAGLDYAHGTGHGVGSYLSVHEGPQRIARSGSEKLLAGMILSNEPGCYREGHYGIRLENLVVVTPCETIPGGELAMHGFETLTLVPFDRRLVRPELLTSEERDWLDAYHRRVREEIGPLVDGQARAWLEKATAPLA